MDIGQATAGTHLGLYLPTEALGAPSKHDLNHCSKSTKTIDLGHILIVLFPASFVKLKYAVVKLSMEFTSKFIMSNRHN